MLNHNNKNITLWGWIRGIPYLIILLLVISSVILMAIGISVSPDWYSHHVSVGLQTIPVNLGVIVLKSSPYTWCIEDMPWILIPLLRSNVNHLIELPDNSQITGVVTECLTIDICSLTDSTICALVRAAKIISIISMVFISIALLVCILSVFVLFRAVIRKQIINHPDHKLRINILDYPNNTSFYHENDNDFSNSNSTINSPQLNDNNNIINEDYNHSSSSNINGINNSNNDAYHQPQLNPLIIPANHSYNSIDSSPYSSNIQSSSRLLADDMNINNRTPYNYDISPINGNILTEPQRIERSRSSSGTMTVMEDEINCRNPLKPILTNDDLPKDRVLKRKDFHSMSFGRKVFELLTANKISVILVRYLFIPLVILAFILNLVIVIYFAVVARVVPPRIRDVAVNLLGVDSIEILEQSNQWLTGYILAIISACLLFLAMVLVLIFVPKIRLHRKTSKPLLNSSNNDIQAIHVDDMNYKSHSNMTNNTNNTKTNSHYNSNNTLYNNDNSEYHNASYNYHNGYHNDENIYKTSPYNDTYVYNNNL